MTILIINIFLALTWAALSGAFTLETLVVGFLLGYLALYLTRGALGKTSYFTRGGMIVRFVIYFTWELIVANLRVARDVLTPGPLRLKPRVVAVPIERCSDLEATFLANVLSLTPGTLSLDATQDPRILFIHAIHAPDAEETKEQVRTGFGQLVYDLFHRDHGAERNK